jgi:hypothetical protein
MISPSGLPGLFCGYDRVKSLWGGTVPPRRRGGPAASFQLNLGVGRRGEITACNRADRECNIL